MRNILIGIAALIVSCTGPDSGVDPRAGIVAALDVLRAGIESEDAILASQPIGENFFLAQNVSSRYSTLEWDATESTPAVGRFRLFFDDAFNFLANPQQEFTVVDIDSNGSIATVEVESRFDAVLTDVTPAENVTYTTTDYMLFEFQSGGWRLVRWDELPLVD